ncbi:MAG: hypothetical protein KC621_19510 [Myxococcales bacterium]|nr:hypothetical protein [Myxococcales bacterium]
MSAVELLARLKHDLGKAVSFQQRWLADPEDDEGLRSALVEDLLRTRRSGDDVSSAVELWARLRPALAADPTIGADEELRAIDAEVATLGEVAARLPEASPEDLRRAAASARQVTELCRGWWARRRS